MVKTPSAGLHTEFAVVADQGQRFGTGLRGRKLTTAGDTGIVGTFVVVVAVGVLAATPQCCCVFAFTKNTQVLGTTVAVVAVECTITTAQTGFVDTFSQHT